MSEEKHVRDVKDIMLDLETLSTRSNAAILVIAALKFDRTSELKSLEEIPEEYKFYEKIDLVSCTKKGMHICEDTVKWWGKQDEKTRNEAFNGARSEIFDVLKKFFKWFSGCEYIWSHGATFDIPILASAYNACNLKIPWNYWNCRDTRTLYDFGNVKIEDLPSTNKHNALYDCWRQVYGVKLSLKNLRL